jgi:hypothetical protein
MFQERWEQEKNFHYVTQAFTQSIGAGSVVYQTADGARTEIPADSVVLSGGRQPNRAQALDFYGTAPEFYMVGDCKALGNVQKCMRAAFAAASRI